MNACWWMITHGHWAVTRLGADSNSMLPREHDPLFNQIEVFNTCHSLLPSVWPYLVHTTFRSWYSTICQCWYALPEEYVREFRYVDN